MEALLHPTNRVKDLYRPIFDEGYILVTIFCKDRTWSALRYDFSVLSFVFMTEEEPSWWYPTIEDVNVQAAWKDTLNTYWDFKKWTAPRYLTPTEFELEFGEQL